MLWFPVFWSSWSSRLRPLTHDHSFTSLCSNKVSPTERNQSEHRNQLIHEAPSESLEVESQALGENLKKSIIRKLKADETPKLLQMFLKASKRHATRFFSSLRLGPEKPSSCVILLHGLGDTAEGWLHGAHFLAESLPETRFLLPTAPVQPVSLNGGMAMPSWYDIRGLGERADEPCDGIDDSRKTVQSLIQAQLDEGLTHEKIILAGFSQGGALSLYTGLSLDYRIAGIVCMSGYLPFTRSFRATPEALQTPVLHCHGSADQMVQLSWAEAGVESLRRQNVKVDFRLYDMGHSACEEELEEVGDWMADHFKWVGKLDDVGCKRAKEVLDCKLGLRCSVQSETTWIYCHWAGLYCFLTSYLVWWIKLFVNEWGWWQ